MKKFSYLSLAAAVGVAACSSAVQQSGTTTPQSSSQAPVPAQLPMKHAAEPTVAAITPRDLMTRLYIFADDSMGGRPIGTEYNLKGTAYIAAELKRLGLQPAGDNGTYFQNIHLFERALDSTSTITVDGKKYIAGTDFLAGFSQNSKTPTGGQVVYFGMQLDTTNIPDLTNKIVVLDARRSPDIKIVTNDDVQKLLASHGYQAYLDAINSAAATVLVSATAFTDARRQAVFHPTSWNTLMLPLLGTKPAPISITADSALVNAMLGAPMANATKGMTGKNITLNVKYVDVSMPGRNVVAILPGSDPKLKNTYVAIGAHNDHVPMRTRPIDHDSLRAYLTVIQTGGAEGPIVPANQVKPEQWARVNAIKDSLRAAHGGIRMDSINNGADDDGTGSMGVLEIAEAFAKAPAAQRPKRSIIFVWHAGEERGMFGSEYFTDYPTVPRDSIVAQLNVDMIGRGGKDDPVPWGGPSYLQLIGSRRLSTELGDIVERVNTDTNAGFKFDYQFDADGESHNYYCRSDHWAYARYGIPITFFTTGGHRDYHQVTDEPQYIDYNHYAHVAQLIHDIGARVANLDHRPVVAKQKGDPYGTCKQ